MKQQRSPIDINVWKKDFPIFQRKNLQRPLVYLDSASSAQKPQQVVDAINHFYTTGYANIHRGIYELSEKASHQFENCRHAVKQFINGQTDAEIIFVRSTTEGINLIAQSFGREKWQAGDEVILSEMEHHSNIVPWYLLKQQIGIELKIIPVEADGSLNIEAYKKLFSARTKLVSVTHASNVLGTINPIKEMTAIAHAFDVPILVDGAQAAPHMTVDVNDLDCDFYLFSSHKLYGPSGVGVIYAKKKYLDQMTPYQGGGGMIETVSFDKITFAKSPHRFEAGTPDIAGVIGFHAAINYINSIGLENIFAHEQVLLNEAELQLTAMKSVRLIGTARPKLGVISFVMDAAHPHDVGTILDHHGVAIRAGHHCAMPLMERFQVPATARVSFGLYNSLQDVHALVEALKEVEKVFA